MATAIPLQTDNLALGLESYPRRLPITDLDYNDSRYPTIGSSSSKHRPTPSQSDRPLENPHTEASRASWIDFTAPTARLAGYSEPWVREKFTEEPSDQARTSQYQLQDADLQVESRLPDGAGVYSSSSGSPYLPPDAFDSRPGTLTYTPSVQEQSQPTLASRTSLQTPDMGQRVSGLDQYRDHGISSSPKHPSLPAPGVGAGGTSSNGSPIVPMSAGPSYASAAMAIPISPKPRAYAQQPTYITPASAPNPINPVYSPPQMSKEEVCVECAMRDQDMADVDVTSPGVWRRDSDADFEELLQRDLEDEAAGIVQPENSSRPRARGGRLTVENLKLWLAINPKEPSSRQQTLDQYVKAQRSLLEAEALAHARAMRESRQLDDKMRDAYSQLRRSAYELGSSAQPMDDSGGVRIKAPRSASTPNAMQSHNREVTLLENGMIVEHVDVRMEERERKKREERRERSRVRKTSRGSRAADVMSVYSLQTPLPTATDSGFFSGARTDSRYSQSIAARPSSVITAGGERPTTLLRAQSQASFSDMQSVGSGTSPRRSRFFGLRNLSSNWRSRESFAPSGSMIDMHVALQREQQYFQQHPSQEIVDIGSNAPTVRVGESWSRMEAKPEAPEAARTSKKPKGLKKIWKLVTGSSSKSDSQHNVRSTSMSIDRADDDTPLAPPPPLSYLVDQGGRRHSSTTSLPSIVSPNTLSPYANSPPTAPSSLQPSPTSSRRSTDKDRRSDSRKSSDILAADQEDQSPAADASPQELRGRTTHSSWTLSSATGPATPPLSASPSTRPASAALRRDKSLPPLPGEHMVEFPSHPMPEGRPQTMFTYDPRSIHGELSPPQAPFRTQEARRQSFGGIGSKPHAAQTMPVRGALARGQLNVPPFLAEEKYSEFGASRMSVQWPSTPQDAQGLQAPPLDKPRKRKSKFGLSTLFGKKASNDPVTEPFDYSALRASTVADSRDSTVVAGSGYASPLSASSHAPRMSVVSRKNLDELVDQDPEFIAYRYPSSDQRLDLLR